MLYLAKQRRCCLQEIEKRALAAYAAIVEVFALEQVPILLLQATSMSMRQNLSDFVGVWLSERLYRRLNGYSRRMRMAFRGDTQRKDDIGN